jgi:triphosphatase
VAREVELKFDVEPGGGAAVRRAAVLSAVPSRTRVHDSHYFDTADGKLRRAGYSLRVRRTGKRHVQTVKQRNGQSAGLFVRREWESEVAGPELDSAALEATPLARLLAGSGGYASLGPLARTRFRRTAWMVDFEGARIEVVLDEGTVSRGRETTPLSELELELIEGCPADLFALAKRIAASAPLRLGVLSKIERAQALADGTLHRAAKAEPARVKASSSEGAAFHAIARACLRQFRRNELVLLERPDAEALHQARVALRRLRAAMSLFRSALGGTDYRQLRDELRWLAGQLGGARDLDVLSARAVGNSTLLEALKPLCERAHAKAATVLRTKRARTLMLRLSGWIELGGWRSGKRAASRLSKLAGTRLERQWRRMARAGDKLHRLDATGRHNLRIAVKKLRYAAEFLAPIHAARPLSTQRDRFIAALKAMQDRLGDLNDTENARMLAKRLPAPLRDALIEAHDTFDQRRLLRQAERAFRRAAGASGYWNESLTPSHM